MVLPPHLKKISKALDSGRRFNIETGKPGRKLNDSERRGLAKLTGAAFYRNVKGKKVKLRIK